MAFKVKRTCREFVVSQAKEDNPNTSRASKGLRPETLLSSLLVVLLVNVIQRSVGFGRAVLFCRWLDAEVLGLWEMAIGFMLLAAPLVVFGIPGSFGRYLEKFRQQGQLGLFLKKTTLRTFLFATTAIGLMVLNLESLSVFVFGDGNQSTLAAAMLISMGIIILHHFFEAIFAGLRLYRVVSTMHFIQSMSFTALSLGLVIFWQADAVSLVAGYGGACLLSILIVSVWAWTRVDIQQDGGSRLSNREFWPPLMQFAIWIWVTNVLTNIFSVVDRYMILHFSGFENEYALELLGNYHSSMIVPVLLISVANLLVGAMTPHLSHSWEQGDRKEVNNLINLSLKIIAIVMTVGGVAVLWICPWLFEQAFGNKFADGLKILPWTVGGCIWFSILLVAQTYTWCTEKSRRAALPLLVGLIANVCMNLLLMPWWGLLGAVIATGLATLAAVYSQYAINRRLDMQVSRGAWVAPLLPFSVVLGPSAGIIGISLVLLISISTEIVFTQEERGRITQVARERLTGLFARFKINRPKAVS